MRLLTASLNALPAENLAVFAAGILISAPVAGLRPSLAALLPDLKVPKPISCTTPPLVTALIILSMTELKTLSADALESSASAAIFVSLARVINSRGYP